MPKRWVSGGIWAVLMSMGLLMGARNTVAEQPTKPEKIIISEVIITGNRRMSTEQIKTHLRTQPGKKLDPAVLNDDVRELYKTGQFSNITYSFCPDGIDRVKITFSVRETPNMVQKAQKVTFLGAKHIKRDELENITGVRPGMPINPTLNRMGSRLILEKYVKEGRPSSECRLLKGGDLADTEVVYQITEGPKIKVRDVQLIGNTFVSSTRIRKKIPLQAGGTYNRMAAEAGGNELYTFYRNFGFLAVRIALEIKRDSTVDEVTLIYHIHEGRRYRPTDPEFAVPASRTNGSLDNGRER